MRIGRYLFYIEKFITQFKQQKKIIGHRTRFRRNDVLSLWGGPSRALIKSEILYSGDAQCNTGELPSAEKLNKHKQVLATSQSPMQDLSIL